MRSSIIDHTFHIAINCLESGMIFIHIVACICAACDCHSAMGSTVPPEELKEAGCWAG